MPRRPPEPHVGQHVRRARVSAGLTQAQLAERVEAAIETISRIERGKLAPSVDLLSRIAKAVGTTVDELLAARPTKRTSGARPAVQRVVALLDPLSDAEVDDVRRSITALLKIGGRIARGR
jgi:transcriptional regulator with XRE-family HTH domain